MKERYRREIEDILSNIEIEKDDSSDITNLETNLYKTPTTSTPTPTTITKVVTPISQSIPPKNTDKKPVTVVGSEISLKFKT